MKNVTHRYGVELDWVQDYAEILDGKVEGNFIILPDEIHTGFRYFLNCENGISAQFMDLVYNTDICFRQVNESDDFVAVYYNLTEGEAIFVDNDVQNHLGRWNYNLSFIDSSLPHDYIVKQGSKVISLCIFIKKEIIKGYLEKNPSLKNQIENIFDPKQNTIVKLTRMSNKSFHILMNLHSKNVREESFSFHLKAAVQFLLADYIEAMTLDQIVIDTVNEFDLKDIIKSQAYLIKNIDYVFPGIDFLASESNMSASKYKTLFRKITGLTPNAFFLNNKLLESKRLLVETRLSITEVSDKLNFTNHSYFTVKFKEYFGIGPKDFIKQM
ncbi:AraC family transcriptional regulator [Flavobacterium hercynium]|uniref:HTH araC/xylS-type domain-containing protein n=1 Tax=Flavobacterium hercynium TaxID=387094 RepID=A0A226GN36_9FLAO|nr:AraC family transcriptional regulator [Flavobacterium hercynium]OXA83074.1 hypothetical protein B0A66_22610 [Flavobacterium hercynium]SMP25842.1 AraC-type DNA-binding protein [Flavobacterium hercynium]